MLFTIAQVPHMKKVTTTLMANTVNLSLLGLTTTAGSHLKSPVRAFVACAAQVIAYIRDRYPFYDANAGRDHVW